MSEQSKEGETAAAALTILAILDGALSIIAQVNAWRLKARERGELTPEMEAKLDEKLRLLFANPAWELSSQSATDSKG